MSGATSEKITVSGEYHFATDKKAWKQRPKEESLRLHVKSNKISRSRRCRVGQRMLQKDERTIRQETERILNWNQLHITEIIKIRSVALEELSMIWNCICISIIFIMTDVLHVFLTIILTNL